MARTRIVKMGAVLLAQFILLALNFQLFGMVTAYKIVEMRGETCFWSHRRTTSYCITLSALKSLLLYSQASNKILNFIAFFPPKSFLLGSQPTCFLENNLIAHAFSAQADIPFRFPGLKILAGLKKRARIFSPG